MDDFLIKMYNEIKESIEGNPDSLQFLNDLRTHLEEGHYRWAYLDIDKYREKGHVIQIDEKVLEEFWWKYAN